MPNLQPTNTSPVLRHSRSLDIPDLPLNACFAPQPGVTASGWMPGINIQLADYMLIRQDSYDMGGYLRVGGDASRVVGHWLGEDNIIEPMWNQNTFHNRVEKLRGWGTRVIAVSDFSTWAEWPLALRIYNVYRTALVTVDFARAGFKILPAVKMVRPEFWDLFNGWIPDQAPTILLDLHHINRTDTNWRVIQQCAKLYIQRFPKAVTWIWSYTPKYAQWWAGSVGPCQWVPTRSYMQNKVVRARQELRRRAEPSPPSSSEPSGKPPKRSRRKEPAA